MLDLAVAPSLDPRFGTGETAMTVALVVLVLVYLPLRGRRRFERLVAQRERDARAVTKFWLRFYVTWWTLAIAVVVVILADPGGLALRDIGLAWPTASGGTALAAALTVGLMVAQVVGVRRARAMFADRPWPRRLLVVTLVRTERERRLAVGGAATAGICEEVVFRGLFIAAAMGLLGLSPFTAALLSAAAFGAAHLYQGPAGMAGSAAVGLAFALLYQMSGSLLLPIVAHTANDTIGFMAIRPPSPARSP